MRIVNLTGLLVRASIIALAASAAQGQAQDAPAPATAAPDATADAGSAKDIVVTGTRAAQQRANANKRDAGNTIEQLQANDVGKLPDQNVAEAIKRLPGLSVANDQGEGRYVIIRGINPALTNVALNGQTLPAPEPTSRQVKLDDLPTGLIQSVTVSKTLLASQDANAIGGEVNITTKTAFDSRKRFFFDALGAVGQYSLNSKSPWEANGTFGGRFGPGETFGAVLSVNYTSRPIESENFQGTTNWGPATAPNANTGIISPDAGGARDYNLVRTRLGIVGNFDWRPNPDVKVYIRSSYTKFTDNETRDQNLLDSIAYTNAATKPAYQDTYTARGSVLVRRREEDDNTKTVTLGGEFKLPVGELSVSGGWTRAIKLDPIRSEFNFRTGTTVANGAISGTANLAPSPYIFSNLFQTDFTRYTFNSLNIETRQAAEQIWQGRADYKVPLGLGDGSTFQVGVKYLDRHKTNNQDRTNYTTVPGALGSTSFQLASVYYLADPSFYGSTYTFGPRIDYWAARAYLAAHPGVAQVNTTSSISATLANDYDVSEDIIAGYAMATLKFGRVTVIPGVRVENTKESDKAKIINRASTLTDGYNSFGSSSYTDVFPGLNVRWEAVRNLVVRGAVTTATGRPDYSQLAPTVSVVEGTPTTVSLGNPNLKPYYAVNVDSSLEYYPNKDSLFSVGFFYKHIDNPIYQAGNTVLNGTYAGVTYPSALVTQYINADYQVLRGVEVIAQTQFTFLPGVLSGFGIGANYSHITGHAIAASYRPGRLPLLDQSGDVGNVQVFYEKYGFAARVAFNYRSAYLDTLASSAAADQYTDANGQLDFHLSYQVKPQFTVFLDATNLTDAPWRRYIGARQYLVERERYEALVRGGVQVHF